MFSTIKRWLRKDSDRDIESILPKDLNAKQAKVAKDIAFVLEKVYLHLENDILRKSLGKIDVKAPEHSYFERALFCHFIVSDRIKEAIGKSRLPDYIEQTITNWITLYHQVQFEEIAIENRFKDISDFISDRYKLCNSLLHDREHYNATQDERFHQKYISSLRMLEWIWFEKPFSKRALMITDFELMFCIKYIMDYVQGDFISLIDKICAPVVSEIDI